MLKYISIIFPLIGFYIGFSILNSPDEVSYDILGVDVNKNVKVVGVFLISFYLIFRSLFNIYKDLKKSN